MKPPFKCYIYQTKKPVAVSFSGTGPHISEYDKTYWYNKGSGRVIGEFVCDWIEGTCGWRLRGKTGLLARRNERETMLPELACLSIEEIEKYAGGENGGIYGWHISDLVIYDRPLELRQFVVEGDCDCLNCRNCFWRDPGNGYNVEDDCNLVYEYLGSGISVKPLFRPPQSWCYVEEAPYGKQV